MKLGDSINDEQALQFRLAILTGHSAIFTTGPQAISISNPSLPHDVVVLEVAINQGFGHHVQPAGEVDAFGTEESPQGDDKRSARHDDGEAQGYEAYKGQRTGF